ncbi:MAG: T9SS type A sorting domain-containing protein, partial [Fidelibacterota bacterium]
DDKAVIVTGKFEIMEDMNAWSPLRYGIFYHSDPGALATSETQMYIDSSVTPWDTTYNVEWNGSESGSYGYMFTPRLGTNGVPSGSGGSGEVWATENGNWISTWTSTSPIGVVPPAPARAYMTAGVYNFAMSVQLVRGINEVRFYMVKEIATGEEQPDYWFGGILDDPNRVASMINGICFSINNNAEDMTGYKLSEVKVDYTDPFTIPEKPFSSYYLDNWAFGRGLTGGWDLEYGDFVGDVGVSGTAAPDTTVTVRGEFIEPHPLKEGKALQVTGSITLVGGGFEDANSLRFGLFYSEAAGVMWQDSTVDSNWVWNGTHEHHTGYLILPQSGTNGPAEWAGIGATGTWGGVVDGSWLNTDDARSNVLGSQAHTAGAVAGAGTYDFVIEVVPLADGTNKVAFRLDNTDGSYSVFGSAVDNHVALVADEFNCVGFAIDNSTTTAMNLTEVMVDMIPSGTVGVDKDGPALPMVYALHQNYPNPFNPTSTIKYELPEMSDVSLVVYNLLGREIIRLVDRSMRAGYHQVQWNGIDARGRAVTSGLYIARLVTPEYTKSIKMLLLK